MATFRKLRTIIRCSSVNEEPILVKTGTDIKSAPRKQITTVKSPINSKMAPQTIAAVLGLRSLLNAFKSSIDYAKSLVNSKYLAYPSLANTKVIEFKIPLITKIKIDGIDYNTDSNSEIDAEWVMMPKHQQEQDLPNNQKQVVLYIHGGAYVFGSIKLYRAITSRVADYSDAPVLAINYRLAPDHVYPSPLIDCLSAYKFLLDNDYLPSNISIVGDSAGAGIATALVLYCRDSELFPLPSCLACMSPYYDLTHSLPSWRLNEESCYLPEGIPDKKYISNNRTNLAVAHDIGFID